MSNDGQKKDEVKGRILQDRVRRKRPISEGQYECIGSILENAHNIAQSRNLRYYDAVSKEQQLREAIQRIYNLSSSEAKKYSSKAHAEIASELSENFSSAAENMALPEKAKVLYVDREDKKQNPLDFFEVHYGDLKRAGILFGDDLLRLDRQLSTNMRSFCQRNKLDASVYMPPPRHARTDILVAIGDDDNFLQSQLRAQNALKRRLQIQARKNL